MFHHIIFRECSEYKPILPDTNLEHSASKESRGVVRSTLLSYCKREGSEMSGAGDETS